MAQTLPGRRLGRLLSAFDILLIDTSFGSSISYAVASPQAQYISVPGAKLGSSCVCRYGKVNTMRKKEEMAFHLQEHFSSHFVAVLSIC